MKTFIFATDLHGDHQNPRAVDALLSFNSQFDPDIRIFGGDLFDFRAIRRGAGKAEQSDSMCADVEAGLQFLENFRPNIFLRGNHDERLWDTALYTDSGLIRDAAEAGIRSISQKCKKIKCKMLPYDSRKGIYQLGKITFLHGYHTGMYATKKHAEVYAVPGGIVLHGHTHSIQSFRVARLGGATGMGVGCLADLNPEYNRHQTARLMHEHGFAYGFSDGASWEVFQAKPNINKKWVVASKLVEI